MNVEGSGTKSQDCTEKSWGKPWFPAPGPIDCCSVRRTGTKIALKDFSGPAWFLVLGPSTLFRCSIWPGLGPWNKIAPNDFSVQLDSRALYITKQFKKKTWF